MDLKDFEARLRDAQVNRACDEIGLDFQIFLSDEVARRYADHDWIVQPNPQVGTVINAVPPLDLTDKIPWEEWFRSADGFHHHVLYTEPHPKSTETWQGPPDDQDHPAAVLGPLWHVYNDADRTPVLIRNR